MSQHLFPQNLPYMQGNANNLHFNNTNQQQKKQREKGQGTNSQFLMQRIQDLERQLSSLNTLLTEDGGFQQAYNQLQQQNEQLKALLSEQQAMVGQSKQLQISNQLLKQNLLKQNEEMEDLYQQLVEARNSQSRMQERGQSQYLQSKVQELNDQISNLLLKIQQLVDQNNQRQNNQQQLSQQFQSTIKQFHQNESKMKNLQVQNQILKEQIHNMEDISMNQQKEIQDKYMKEMEDLIQQIEQLKSNLQKRPGQIRGNTQRIAEERIGLQEEINMLRNELASKNEQLLWQKENEANLRRKWEERMINSQGQARSMSEQANKLRNQLRREENKRSQLQFVLQQQQKDRQRLNFYKNNYSESEQLRNSIVRLQTQKEELRLRVQRLQVQLSQTKFEPIQYIQQGDKNPIYNFMQQQTEDELEKSKKLNKELKAAIGKYQEDYRTLRRDYEKLLQEKCQAERFVNINQLQLNKHKTIYEQLITRYNQTALLYKQVEAKLKILQVQRNQKAHQSSYDKEDIQLIKLENSALRQEINYLKQELSLHSNRIHENTDDLKQQCAESKRRQRQYAQQLEIYRQKYLKELQKSKGDKGLQNKVVDLQDKLNRVNRMLNQKLKELQHLQIREKELIKQVDQAYLKCRMEFDNYGVRHHPQVKKLQSELLSAQRQIMESELAFKQQINNCEDELRLCRLENQHHRVKIDQLLLQVNRQRNSLDYSKLMRSLQLSSLTQKELRRQLDHKDHLINDLRDELKKSQNKQRNRLQSSFKNQLEQLKLQKERHQHRLFQQESHLRELAELLNSLQRTTSPQDTVKRAINFLSKMQASRSSKSQELNQTRQGSYSRYEQLARKKSVIAQQFKQSQKYLYEQNWSGREEKHGILHRLRQNLAT